MDWFSPIDPSKKNSEFIAVESKSFWKAAWGRFKKNPMAVLGLVVILLLAVISIFGPIISPYAYDAQDAANQYAGFSAQHIFGTDKFGRDVFTRLCYGGRISLAIGFGAAVINTVLGVVIGGLCGYIGGKFDNFVMRIVDIIYAMPSMIYVILIMMVLGSNVRSILIGICIPGWIGMARQVRGQLIALKEQEFSMAALVIGASDARILFRHLLINAIGPIIVQITFLVPNAIFTEAFLSFIGIGISAPMASWGSMARDARQVLTMHPGQLLLPTICICITIFSLNFLGEGIGDAFNPKKTRG